MTDTLEDLDALMGGPMEAHTTRYVDGVLVVDIDPLEDITDICIRVDGELVLALGHA